MRKIIFLYIEKQNRTTILSQINSLDNINNIRHIFFNYYLIDYDLAINTEIYNYIYQNININLDDYNHKHISYYYLSLLSILIILLFLSAIFKQSIVQYILLIINLLFITTDIYNSIHDYYRINTSIIIALLINTIIALCKPALLFIINVTDLSLNILLTIYKLLPDYLIYKSNKNILNTINNLNKSVNVKQDNHYIKLDLKQVSINDIVTYNKGDLVSLDGILINDNAIVNTKILDGLNNKVIYANQYVYAGYINYSDNLSIKVTDTINSRYIDKLYYQQLNNYHQDIYSLINTNNQYNDFNFIIFIISFIISLLSLIFTHSFITSLLLFTRLIPVLIFINPMYLQLCKYYCMNNYLNSNGIVCKNINIYDYLLNKLNILIPYYNVISNNKEVVDVLVDQQLDNTELNTILFTIFNKANTPSEKAILEYVKNFSIQDSDLNKVKNIYHHGINNYYDNNKFSYGTLKQCQENNIDVTNFIKVVDNYEKKGQYCYLITREEKVISLITLKDILANNIKVFNDQLNTLDSTSTLIYNNLLNTNNYIADTLHFKYIKHEKDITNKTIINDINNNIYTIDSTLNYNLAISIKYSNVNEISNYDITCINRQYYDICSIITHYKDINNYFNKAIIYNYIYTLIIYLLFIITINLYTDINLYPLFMFISIIMYLLNYSKYKIYSLYKFNDIPLDLCNHYTLQIKGNIDDNGYNNISNVLNTYNDITYSYNKDKQLITIDCSINITKTSIITSIRKLGYYIKEYTGNID